MSPILLLHGKVLKVKVISFFSVGAIIFMRKLIKIISECTLVVDKLSFLLFFCPRHSEEERGMVTSLLGVSELERLASVTGRKGCGL